MRLILPFLLLPISLLAQSIKKENLGPNINTKLNDLAPVLSLDGKSLYFIIEGHSKNTRSYNSNSQDIWYSEKDSNGVWSVAKHATKPFNQRLYNSIECISKDGSVVYIRGAYKDGEYIGSGFSYLIKTKTGWSNPIQMNIQDLEKMNKGLVDAMHICSDNKTMILAFSQQKGSKINDLYVSFKTGPNSWSKPKYISSLNTKKYIESTPFVAADNKTLYFSSDKPGGVGGRDIYMTQRLDDTWMKWSTPQNLGDSINTEGWDAYFITDASAQYAYIVSNQDSYGESDIFRFRLPQVAQPTPVAMVTGTIQDNDNKLISTMVVAIDVNTNKIIQESACHPTTGKFTLFLNYGSDYIITLKNNYQYTQPVEISLSKDSISYKEINVTLDYTEVRDNSVLTVKLQNETISLTSLNQIIQTLKNNSYTQFEIVTTNHNLSSVTALKNKIQESLPSSSIKISEDNEMPSDMIGIKIIH
ncbi:MAG: OmpA family protein [Cytophagaceae bacterium]